MTSPRLPSRSASCVLCRRADVAAIDMQLARGRRLSAPLHSAAQRHARRHLFAWLLGLAPAQARTEAARLVVLLRALAEGEAASVAAAGMLARVDAELIARSRRRAELRAQDQAEAASAVIAPAWVDKGYDTHTRMPFRASAAVRQYRARQAADGNIRP